jgi:hypothetical protein
VIQGLEVLEDMKNDFIENGWVEMPSLTELPYKSAAYSVGRL